MKKDPVRVRFAPSPTGVLHIGGARTALFNLLFARKMKGTFVLRVEDTDRQRSTNESIQAILDGMEWLGIDYDEGPYYQSQRSDIYGRFLDLLISEERVYKCYSTPEEVEAMRQKAMKEGRKPKYDGYWRDRKEDLDKPYVWRFKSDLHGFTTFQDAILGEVKTPNEELDDWVIARQDGTPTYNFTVVVDDFDMCISHVLRGNDHLNNTPKQVQLYRALGISEPIFAHLPMILGQDGKKLSKRHGATSVEQYREEGYLPEALNNFLVRLGWSHGDQEIFSRAEMTEHFEISGIGKSSGVFSQDKMVWVNQEYLKSTDSKELWEHARAFLQEKHIPEKFDEKYKAYLDLAIPRAKNLKELAESLVYYFTAPETYQEKPLKKFVSQSSLEAAGRMLDKLDSEIKADLDKIEELFQETLKLEELKMPQLGQSFRLALCGTSNAPGVYELLQVFDVDTIRERLKKLSSFLADAE